ncbi:MAG: alpha-ribazole phosphatase [Bacillota bacterium]
METELIIIRHGETDWNKQHKYQGQQDIDLNQQGYQQARQTGSYLASRKIDALYSSDLKRAYHTAQKINQYQELEIQCQKKLREMDFGTWEGLTYQEIKEKNPQLLAEWNRDPAKINPPRGENLQIVQQRAKKCFQEIIADNEGKKVLIVSHGGVIKVFLATILNMDLKNYWQFNVDQTGINIIKFYEGKAIIKQLNNRSHLE